MISFGLFDSFCPTLYLRKNKEPAMKRTVLLILPILIIITVLYLAFWPVSIQPVAWQPPVNKGFTGDFASNDRLNEVKLYSLNGHTGPEALVQDSSGNLYTATHDGWILKFENGEWLEWVNTQGRPLGLDMDQQGNLIAADAFRGLLKISPEKHITLLTNAVGDSQIKYANDLDISSAGIIYFSDSSTKFGALENGGTYEASLLDLIEHGGHGRLLSFNPENNETRVLIEGLNFANGVALDPKENFILINETGSYRTLKFWLKGENAGETEVLVDNLPGFPDNLSTGKSGRFWLGLPSPRNKILDTFSENTVMRKVIQRLPAFMRPKAVAYGHVVAIDENGNILSSLQDPAGKFPITTGVLETEEALYISSLMADSVAELTNVTF